MARRLALLLLFTLGISGHASAVTAPDTSTVRFIRTASTNDYNVLEQVAGNAAVGSRTYTAQLDRQYAWLKAKIFYTYSAGSAIVITLSCAGDGNAADSSTTYHYAQPTTRSCSSGTCTLYKQSETFATGSASHTDPGIEVTYPVSGCVRAKVVISITSGDANDKWDLQLTASNGL